MGQYLDTYVYQYIPDIELSLTGRLSTIPSNYPTQEPI